MKLIKLTKKQYESIRKPYKPKHVNCTPRESTEVISTYSRRIAKWKTY